jgi:hypothetical protein
MKDTDRCCNCHREFADHDYVKDSIDQYKCPILCQETGYGGFNGGDPRNFHPDAEECRPTELEAHRKACEIWNESEAKGETPEPEKCPSGWIYNDEGEVIAHVLRMPYGIGVYTISHETLFEPIEYDEEEA